MMQRILTDVVSDIKKKPTIQTQKNNKTLPTILLYEYLCFRRP